MWPHFFWMAWEAASSCPLALGIEEPPKAMTVGRSHTDLFFLRSTVSCRCLCITITYHNIYIGTILESHTTMFFRRPFRHRDNLNLGRPHKSSGSTKILAWLARWAISYGLPFAMGMMLMYVLLISLYMSHDHHHHQQQQTRAGHGRPKTIPEEYQWITSPRATKDGATCDPPLLCAWSLDHPRTQLASLNLWHKAATKPDQPLPTAAQSLEATQKGHPTWVEQHYDQLNAWYTASDANFLHRTGVVHLHLPEDIHVIPMGGEGMPASYRLVCVIESLCSDSHWRIWIHSLLSTFVTRCRLDLGRLGEK